MAASHIFSDSSQLPVAMREPSRLNTVQSAPRECISCVNTTCPVRALNTVMSFVRTPVAASCRPFGLKTSLLMLKKISCGLLSVRSPVAVFQDVSFRAPLPNSPAVIWLPSGLSNSFSAFDRNSNSSLPVSASHNVAS